jgi:uncharacterized protein YodC (DUF2158 family)
MDFKPGDIVRLKSGGPLMVVDEIDKKQTPTRVARTNVNSFASLLAVAMLECLSVDGSKDTVGPRSRRPAGRRRSSHLRW